MTLCMGGQRWGGSHHTISPPPPPPPPSDFVKVAVTHAHDTGRIVVVPPGNLNLPIASLATKSGYSYDFRDTLCHQHPPKDDPIFVASDASDVIIFGQRTQGDQDNSTTTWADMKNNYDDNACNTGGDAGGQTGTLTVENFAWYSPMDGFNPRPKVAYAGDGPQRFIMRGGYARDVRDDFCENDNIMSGLIEDCLVDGAFMMFSQRPGKNFSGTLDNTTVLTLRNSFFWVKPMYYDARQAPGKIDATHSGVPPSPNPGPACGTFFKWDPGSGIIDAADCIFRCDQISLSNTGAMTWGKGGGPHIFSHCLLVWLGPGAWPGQKLPTGMDLSTDIADWNSERDNWLRAHGNFDGTGNDFPFLHR